MADTVKNVKIRVQGKADAGIFSDVKKQLDETKKTFGRRGLFGELTQIAVGGGAIAGVTFAVRQVDMLAAGAAKLADELRRGVRPVSEIADEFARTIPILGSIYSAGQSIREVFTGERVEIERILESAKTLDLVSASWARGMKAVADSHGDAADFMEKMNQQRKLMGLEGVDRDLFQSGVSSKGVLAGITDNEGKRIRGIEAANKIEIEKLRKQISEVNIPMMIGSVGDEFGRGSGQITNQAEIDAAVQQREDLKTRIVQIEKRQAADIAEIQDDARQKTRSANEFFQAEQEHIRKAAAEVAAKKESEDRIRELTENQKAAAEHQKAVAKAQEDLDRATQERLDLITGKEIREASISRPTGRFSAESAGISIGTGERARMSGADRAMAEDRKEKSRINKEFGAAVKEFAAAMKLFNVEHGNVSPALP